MFARSVSRYLVDIGRTSRPTRARASVLFEIIIAMFMEMSQHVVIIMRRYPPSSRF